MSHSFGYIMIPFMTLCWVLAWQTCLVEYKRKMAGVQYPQMYAEKAEADNSKTAYVFNCANRAHQNTLEVLPVILMSTIIMGIDHPVVAAMLCEIFALSRVFYTLGYMKEPLKRVRGARVSSLATLGLLLGATKTSLNFVLNIVV
ncbi:membrane-associated proteins in eicosanoid and glutathione metabolism [Coniophora puteana RWD-64-598 SS2]|uniref:Membrane-associated proteins in eicosanoid and glutathione metabolism n=1 Tax=Coniophora puteana (strain RWD-64-598) TaxID=741705 RepID=A0A5M3N7S5_CONPW|nr:membrane-associated proteins in eicosanoid and glutathione metabolism [Coniophora puteana RWD-64-598 SS2]EIW86911.1 membrane-associated proteins in eicosanoid and glutathione metabolism [Coniophora puteana RWD-64-598 SS2]